MPGIKVCPSFLGLTGDALDRFLVFIVEHGADYLHVDFGDGTFIPEKSDPKTTLLEIPARVGLPAELHLMVDDPKHHVECLDLQCLFHRRALTTVIVHPEAAKFDFQIIQQIKSLGFAVGIALRPDTDPVSISNEVYHQLDLVVVMTVVPGKSGQTMITDCLLKVNTLRYWRTLLGYEYQIQVDGGVNKETAILAVAAGADRLVAGGYVQKDPANIRILHQLTHP